MPLFDYEKDFGPSGGGSRLVPAPRFRRPGSFPYFDYERDFAPRGAPPATSAPGGFSQFYRERIRPVGAAIGDVYEEYVAPFLDPVMGALNVGSAAVGRAAGELFPEAYERAAAANAQPEQEGLTALKAAPGVGQIVAEEIAPGPREGWAGAAKTVASLVGDIFTDPLTYATGGLAAGRQLASAGKPVRAAAQLLSSPLVGTAYAPDIVKGVASGVDVAAQNVSEHGVFSEEVGAPLVQAGVVAALGGAMAAGARSELAAWKERSKVAAAKGQEPPPPPANVPPEALVPYQPPPIQPAPNWTSPTMGQPPTGVPVRDPYPNPNQPLLPTQPRLTEGVIDAPEYHIEFPDPAPPSGGVPPRLMAPGLQPAPGVGALPGGPVRPGPVLPSAPQLPALAPAPGMEGRPARQLPPAPLATAPELPRAGEVPAAGAEAAVTRAFDELPDELFIDQNRYVASNDQEAAARLTEAYAARPERARFIENLRNLSGGRDTVTLYRVGEVEPGKFQSYSLSPERLGFFENKRGSKAQRYEVPVDNVAFPGSANDLEVVVRSPGPPPRRVLRPEEMTPEQRAALERFETESLIYEPPALRDRLEARANAALERLRARGREGSSVNFGVDPTVITDLIDYGASRIAVYGLDKAKWAADMVQQFGESVRARLDEIWEKARSFHSWASEQYKDGDPQDPKRVGYPVRGMVARYMEAHPELPAFDHRTKKILRVDEARAKRIADAFEAMKHDPDDPRVKASYEALKRETQEQYEFAVKEGYTFEPWTKEGQPYQTAAEMRQDVLDNKHLWYFPSESGFGEGDSAPKGNPLLDRAPNGLVYNDMFRAVHDLFAHAKEGFEFGPRGEENAWHEHYQMFSPEARPAMTTETRGQNSWVNFGRHLRVPWAGPEGSPLRELHQRIEQPDGGFTFSPLSTAEPREGFPVSIYPDRAEVVEDAKNLTPDQLAAFIVKNRDILGRADHHLGAWHDPETGKAYLDISVVAKDPSTAALLARQHQQMAYFDIAAGKSVRVEGHGETGAVPAEGSVAGSGGGAVSQADRAGADAGGAGAAAAAPGRTSPLDVGPYTRVPKKGEPGYVPLAKRPYAEQKTGLLPAEFYISQVPPRRRTEPELVREQVKVGERDILGEPVKGSATVPEIAKALEQRTRQKWGKLRGDDASKAVDRAIKLGRAEIEYQLEQVKTGRGWYTKDIAEMEAHLKQVFPDLEDTNRMDLFKAVMASSAGGNHPNLNLDIATKIWERFNATGDLPLKNPENGKNWAGQPSPAIPLSHLNTIKEKVGSWEAVAQYLREKHPVSELRTINKWVPGKATDELPGSAVLGPKFSPFLQNLYGNRESLTADMWFSRTWNRWMGTMFEKTPKGPEVIGAPRSEGERGVMAQAVNKLSEHFGMPTADVQAVLWYYEQQLYKALGARIEEGSYAAAAKRVVDARGVRGRDAGPGAAAAAGREAPLAGAGAGSDAAPRQAGLDFGVSDEPPARTGEPDVGAKAAAPREEVGGLEAAYEAALSRLKARGQDPTAFGGVPLQPQVLSDLGIVGARWIAQGVKSLAEFTGRLVSEFGEWIRSAAESVYNHATSIFSGGSRAAAAPASPPQAAATAGAAPPTGSRPPIRPIPPGSTPTATTGASPAAASSPRPRADTQKASVPTLEPDEARVAGDAAARQGTPPIVGKPLGKGRPDDFDINTERISADEVVEQLNARLVESQPGYFGKTAKGARGEVSRWEDVRVKAVALGADEEQLKRAFRRSGGFLTDVDLERAGMAQKELTARAQKAWKDVESKTGRDQEDARTLYDATISRLAAINYILIGAKAQAARALQLGRKLSEGATIEEQYFHKLAKETGVTDQLRKQLYDAMVRKDYQAARKTLEQIYKPTFMQKVVEGWKAGLLSAVPTQVVNFASTGTKTSLIDPIEAIVAGALDAARGVPAAQRQRFLGEGMAMLKGARAGMEYALFDETEGLLPALRDITSGRFEAKQFERALKTGEEGAIEQQGRISGKKGEVIRIPFQLLNAADNFWKLIAESQSLHRQGFRRGMQQGLKGEELENFIRSFREQYVSGTLANIDSVKAEVKNARLRGTFQENMGPFGRALIQMSNAHPWLDFVVPFKKTPINIAQATIARTPLGLANAIYQYKKGKISEAEAIEKAAASIVGTTLATAMYWAATTEGGLDLTGGGPTDPAEAQNLRDTGWQPYSIKIGDRYVSYQRLEPLSAIIGFAADAKELKDAKSVSEAIEKASGSIAENLTNKTFLSGLTTFAEALQDPKRHFKTWAKQMEGSLVPAIVGKAAQAVDPVVRETDAFETLYGIPEPAAARIPGLSKLLPARRTPAGEDRERGGGPIGRFINPFPLSEEKKGPVADVQREFARLGYVPGQPQSFIMLPGGKRLDLDDREYGLLQGVYNDAAKQVSRLLRRPEYRALPDTEEVGKGRTKQDAIQKIYRDARDRGRARLYQDPAFRRRAAQAKASKGKP